MCWSALSLFSGLVRVLKDLVRVSGDFAIDLGVGAWNFGDQDAEIRVCALSHDPTSPAQTLTF